MQLETLSFRRSVLCVSLLMIQPFLGACPDETAEDDAGGRAGDDGGDSDGGETDGGLVVDAGADGGAIVDGGAGADGGLIVDGGLATDAGLDGGEADGGPVVDAGLDGGTIVDGGTSSDGGYGDGDPLCTDGEIYAKTCWPILPSHITQCSDDNSAIPCPGSAGSITCGITEYCGQAAQYPELNLREFTCVGTDGEDLGACPAAASSGEAVRDDLTGLIWQRADLPMGMDWESAVEHCRELPYGGQVDWRLPSPHELHSIVDESQFEPAISVTAFPEIGGGTYWTSLLSEGLPSNYPWTVNFSDGSVRVYLPLGTQQVARVQCVRGALASFGSNPARFEETTILGEDLIKDKLTGLMWQGDFAREKNWDEALAYCESLDYAGYTNWRLPNLRMLASLVNYEPSDPGGDFPGLPLDALSSTPFAGRFESVWVVAVSSSMAQSSTTFHDGAKFNVRDVRCVLADGEMGEGDAGPSADGGAAAGTGLDAGE